MAGPERNDALAMRLQPLSDRWRKFGGSIPCDATPFSSFPSAPLHPMERNRYCKEKSPFCNRSSSSVGKRISNAAVGTGTAGGEIERRRWKMVSHRDAWLTAVGRNVKTHYRIRQRAKLRLLANLTTGIRRNRAAVTTEGSNLLARVVLSDFR